ncbi:MAG: response regulator [Candidatus Omnitrophica bacterium]|nr:response regulator [Candidatus Omnitrophota bacterium]
MSGQNILVVDDEEIIGIVFDRELKEKGFHVDCVLGGEKALEAVRNKKYDLVFIDKTMPGMDGVETCRQLMKICPDTVAIFMTGSFDRDNIVKEQQFVAAGGRTYYLYKPFAQGEIHEVVQKALSERK